MSILDTMYAYEGTDFSLNFDIPLAPSQMDIMFDPMFVSFQEELKPLEINMPYSLDMDMNIQQAEPDVNFMFDPIPVKPEIFTTEESLDCWEVPEAFPEFFFNTPSMANETVFVAEGDGVVLGDHIQLNEVESEVNVGASYFGNVNTQYQTFPYTGTNFGDFCVGAMNHYPLSQKEFERRQKRMIKNRESAARSRARRLAYNAQQKLEIEALKKENEFLKKVQQALVSMNREQEAETAGIPRTSSVTLPPPEMF